MCFEVGPEGIEGGSLSERGSLFHMDGPTTEKERELKVENLDWDIWRLKMCEAERRVRDGA